MTATAAVDPATATDQRPNPLTGEPETRDERERRLLTETPLTTHMQLFQEVADALVTAADRRGPAERRTSAQRVVDHGRDKVRLVPTGPAEVTTAGIAVMTGRSYQHIRDLNSERRKLQEIVDGERRGDLAAAADALLDALPAPTRKVGQTEIWAAETVWRWMRRTRRGNEWYEPVRLMPPGRPRGAGRQRQ